MITLKYEAPDLNAIIDLARQLIINRGLSVSDAVSIAAEFHAEVNLLKERYEVKSQDYLAKHLNSLDPV